MSISCRNLICEGMKEPLGIDNKAPGFGWKMESMRKNVWQTAYRILVAHTLEDILRETSLAWDSGRVESDHSIHIPYAGVPLLSATEYVWAVQIWDNYGDSSIAFSKFETAFLHEEDWKAKWVEPVQQPAYDEPSRGPLTLVKYDINIDDIKMNPAQMLRRDFILQKKVKKARLYMTAHGIYTATINGIRVGDIELAPGNTSYHKYLEYQVYDVTGHLASGGNALGMVIADGWYCGKVGLMGLSCQYGDMLAALFQLEVEYEDGRKERVCSDELCKSSTGPIQYADLFIGEKYDARLEHAGYDRFGFDDSRWTPVNIAEYGHQNLYAPYGGEVKVCQVRKPENIWLSPKGEMILDTGQVLAGRLRMRVKGTAGTKITLEHTEMVDQEGNYLRNVLGVYTHQQDTYILKGGEEEEFEPAFTYHGFRYVRITGYPGIPSVDDFDVLVTYSEMEDTGEFRCSDARLNQLQHNIYWSQISNMVSIPTDCPQREKGGWLGDAQMYTPTASFNTDTNDFFRRWLRNMQKDQMDDGQVPIVVPYIKAYYPETLSTSKKPTTRRNCSAGWSDAAVILPWRLYQIYGDLSVLEENYDMMLRWMGYVEHTASTEFPIPEVELTRERKERMRYLWNTNFHFGDWLTPSVSFNFETGDVDMVKSAFATMDIVPSCFYAYSASLVSKIAGILGKDEDRDYYAALHGKVKQAFVEEFYGEDGLLKTNLQGVYVLALKLGLYPEGSKDKLVDQLVQLIHDNNDCLDTGVMSVPYLLDVLYDNGRPDVAYTLLFQEKCPSWLYEVKMGATSMWEAWQAILPNGTPTTVSYNHYAFGCVGDWIYRTVAGLAAAEPGYKKIRVAPRPYGNLTAACACYESAFGKIICDWRLAHGTMRITAVIPANTTAEIRLPDTSADTVKLDGIRIAGHPEALQYTQEDDGVVVETGSGTYEFTFVINA